MDNLKSEGTMTNEICETCRDWVFYCKCWIGEDRELTDSGEFTITDEKLLATWSPSNRLLSGDQELIDKILAELSGTKETICDVGVIWMEQREPIAVALAAEHLGFQLSGDVPEWGFERDG
jgi:hypothetical protein